MGLILVQSIKRWMTSMPDYKTMYYSLFNSITDVIEILKQAQIQSEQFFIEQQPQPEDPETE